MNAQNLTKQTTGPKKQPSVLVRSLRQILRDPKSSVSQRLKAADILLQVDESIRFNHAGDAGNSNDGNELTGLLAGLQGQST